MKKKIKVVHIVQSPGGVERYLYMLFQYTRNSRYENILICSEEYQESKVLNLLENYEIVPMIRKINICDDFKSIVKIRGIIKEYNPDIVYMHSSKAGALGRIANFGLNNRSIYNPHGWAFNMKCGRIKRNLYSMIEKVLAPLCTKIVVISDFEKKSAIQRRICSPKKIKVIYNGIDFFEYESLKDINEIVLDIPKDAFIIGTVGRLSDQKAPDIFVKSAKLIKEYIPNAFFIMVGDGEMRDTIEELITHQGLKESVIITGWVENPIEYIRYFDIAMLLSRWEGFGLVLAEYMYANVPIIATDVDAIPNIIKDNYNGLLVSPDNIEGVLEAVCKLTIDSSFKERLVKNARFDVETRFNVSRVAKETLEIYDCLNEKNVKGR